MPEYPEVTTVTRTLDKLLRNKCIKDIVAIHPRLFLADPIEVFNNTLQGETIKRIYNIGKYIVWECTNNKVLLNHLRMEGRYYYYAVGETHTLPPHLGAIIKYTDDSIAYYCDPRMFGTFELRTNDTLHATPPISLLAPTPYETSVIELHGRLRKSRRPIKVALLDQHTILGLGNIYVDEVLHAARIHPMTPCLALKRAHVRRIIQCAREILDAAVALGGSSVHSFFIINSTGGGYQSQLRAYARTGKLCTICKRDVIIKTKVYNRGTHYCRTCQRKIDG